PREEVAYVTCTYRETCIDQPDFLATVDLNPRSPCYGQVIHRLPMPNLRDELHCSGWSAAGTCCDGGPTRRTKLILPGLISSRIYVVDVGSQCRAPRLCKTIEPVDVFWKCNRGYLAVVRSLPNGDVLVANTGDAAGNGKGGFVVLDGETFELKGHWENECETPPTGYDFCYQPRHNVLVSSAGSVPKRVGRGFDPDDLKKGAGPRERGPSRSRARRREGLGALGRGGRAPSCPKGPCKRVYGGPSKLQLSLDGRRLYVTNSFYSTWDKQFYPDVVREGSVMLQIDVDTEKGGLCVNKNFLVDFGKEPHGPCLAHDIRFPCGDATS
ncbi:SBP1 oxidase, partial [Bucorvus abyssinicus]|nr:SBP1 oxidase [Bucorvus abyssinicus]